MKDPVNIKLILTQIQKTFEEKISVKTGWGKNEIMVVLKESITDAIIEYLDL